MKDDTKELFREDWQAIKEAREKIFAVSVSTQEQICNIARKVETEGKSLKWPRNSMKSTCTL